MTSALPWRTAVDQPPYGAHGGSFRTQADCGSRPHGGEDDADIVPKCPPLGTTSSIPPLRGAYLAALGDKTWVSQPHED